jgi:endoglucanase Acf2
MIVYATYDMGGDENLAAAGLKNLIAAFANFVDNSRNYPLVYDNDWKGIISSAVFATGDLGSDYGNPLYNDHHFHYGYFVYAASVITYFNSAWLATGSNKAWVDSLVRDYASAVTDDAYFPFSRMFDWYHGHSWAEGLYESGDGKNEESTSEDVFSIYAMKMWGRVTGDKNMEARGNLQLAMLKRSLRNYFLMESDNRNQPAQFIGNMASGIVSFENRSKGEAMAGRPLSSNFSYQVRWSRWHAFSPIECAGKRRLHGKHCRFPIKCGGRDSRLYRHRTCWEIRQLMAIRTRPVIIARCRPEEMPLLTFTSVV